MSIIFNGHYRMEYRTWITEALRLHLKNIYHGLWPDVA
ncbi:hypothetical protein EC2846750_4030 [Escherichia coli 2846750]|nr:hypothetical protein EC2872000_4354 [Escherichia coli 2872000]EMV52605.1 hypothetical protein EC2871950_4244 [Escherichia coli 2871950]EMZ62798.1 hypothetical protein EC2846750_4030 [Escherichia coli 2846750]END89199.1 hypothetical protein ECP03019043_4171 [Escherichia coli P0301904.3]